MKRLLFILAIIITIVITILPNIEFSHDMTISSEYNLEEYKLQLPGQLKETIYTKALAWSKEYIKDKSSSFDIADKEKGEISFKLHIKKFEGKKKTLVYNNKIVKSKDCVVKIFATDDTTKMQINALSTCKNCKIDSYLINDNQSDDYQIVDDIIDNFNRYMIRK